MTRKRLAYLLVAVIVLPLVLSAQNKTPKKSQAQQSQQEDSIARLIQADTLQLIEIRGMSYRKVKGHAKFLHNNTYLICDSALWNVDTKVIDAMGHVQIKQQKTVLTSDKLTYFVDRDLAEFRGDIVKLVDEDHNTLKTKYLDYNTKDSVAVFRNGGAMRDKDGQVIESRTGTYDSKIKTFTFTDDVNMFSDTMFVKTSFLKYESDINMATFGYGTNAWKDDKMLSANAGWYDRGRELFFFQRQVHVMSEDQEAWSDSLYFNRATNDVEMRGHVQVTDTTRNVYAIAGKMTYVDSLGRTTLTRKPAVISETEDTDEQGRTVKDTVYFGADTLIYRAVKMCEVDSLEKVQSAKRVEMVSTDPVSALRKQAAEAAKKAAEEAAANDPNNPEVAKKKAEEAAAAAAAAKANSSKPVREKPTAKGKKSEDLGDAPADAPDTTAQQAPPMGPPPDDTLNTPDSLVAPPPVDTTVFNNPADTSGLVPPVDTTAAEPAVEPLDTTKIGFLHAYKNVRLFRKSMQMVCDSLSYNDLDSLARLYYSPIIWNEKGKHEYCADSIYAVVVDQKLTKANLMSEAFIHIQEDSLHFDQIKSTEMTAFFNDDNQLSRFDALGGASALFYLEEKETLATVNKKECKMMSALFKDGEIEKIYYFDTAKSDGYPVVQMKEEDKLLKGFNWAPEKRPASKEDVTTLKLRPSQRTRYSGIAGPKFVQTDIYFPGYISDIHKQVAVRDSLNKVKAAQDARNKQIREEMEKLAIQDSLARAKADSLALADSLANAPVPTDEAAPSEPSVSEPSVSSTPSAPSDTTSTASKPAEEKPTMSAEELKAQQRAEEKAAKEAAKAAKLAELEKKWAEKDAKIAAKEQAKKDKAAAKARKKKEKALRAQMRQDAKDQARLEAYIEKYQKKLDKKNNKTK